MAHVTVSIRTFDLDFSTRAYMTLFNYTVVAQLYSVWFQIIMGKMMIPPPLKSNQTLFLPATWNMTLSIYSLCESIKTKKTSK